MELIMKGNNPRVPPFSQWLKWISKKICFMKVQPQKSQKLTCLLKRDYFSREYIWTNHEFSGEEFVRFQCQWTGIPTLRGRNCHLTAVYSAFVGWMMSKHLKTWSKTPPLLHTFAEAWLVIGVFGLPGITSGLLGEKEQIERQSPVKLLFPYSWKWKHVVMMSWVCKRGRLTLAWLSGKHIHKQLDWEFLRLQRNWSGHPSSPNPIQAPQDHCSVKSGQYPESRNVMPLVDNTSIYWKLNKIDLLQQHWGLI